MVCRTIVVIEILLKIEYVCMCIASESVELKMVMVMCVKQLCVKYISFF